MFYQDCVLKKIHYFISHRLDTSKYNQLRGAYFITSLDRFTKCKCIVYFPFPRYQTKQFFYKYQIAESDVSEMKMKRIRSKQVRKEKHSNGIGTNFLFLLSTQLAQELIGLPSKTIITRIGSISMIQIIPNFFSRWAASLQNSERPFQVYFQVIQAIQNSIFSPYIQYTKLIKILNFIKARAKKILPLLFIHVSCLFPQTQFVLGTLCNWRCSVSVLGLLFSSPSA